MKAILMILVFVANLLYCNDDDRYIDDGYREFLTREEALEWGNRWLRGSIFTKEEQDVIYDYSKHSWLYNARLRGGEKFEDLPKEDQERIKKLDKAVNKFPLFEALIVFRYVDLSVLEQMYGKETVKEIFLGGDASFLEKTYKGGRFTDKAKEVLRDINKRTYVDPGFMSTTMVRNSVFSERPIELRIKIKKYTTGLFIAREGYTYFIPECEILFGRGRKLYFEGFELSSDMKKLTLHAKMKGPWWYINEGKKKD